MATTYDLDKFRRTLGTAYAARRNYETLLILDAREIARAMIEKGHTQTREAQKVTRYLENCRKAEAKVVGILYRAHRAGHLAQFAPVVRDEPCRPASCGALDKWISRVLAAARTDDENALACALDDAEESSARPSRLVSIFQEEIASVESRLTKLKR